MTSDVLKIDPEGTVRAIAQAIRNQVENSLRRQGIVVGLSGGVDSSVVAALSVRALGKHRVFGLFLPERDSDPDSLVLGRRLAEFLGIETALESITPMLEAMGCYRRRDDAVRTVFPEYGDGYKCKLVLPGELQTARLNVASLVIETPGGERKQARPTPQAYLGIVAASNMKQRTRKLIEYYHADRLHYAVAGTPNRLEYDQGFFVKNGDGAADLKPIAHLYKSQVYQLADHFDLPHEIRQRTPTTDTYSLPQTQEEFYFSMPLDKLDICLYGLNHGIAPAETALAVGLGPEQVERAYKNIAAKRRATRWLHLPPLLVEPIPEPTA